MYVFYHDRQDPDKGNLAERCEISAVVHILKPLVSNAQLWQTPLGLVTLQNQTLPIK